MYAPHVINVSFPRPLDDSDALGLQIAQLGLLRAELLGALERQISQAPQVGLWVCGLGDALEVAPPRED